MPHTLVLQDWVTISGTSSAVSQTAEDYLALGNYQDIVIYTYVGAAAVAGGSSLQIQSAPTKEDALFNLAANTHLTLAAGSTSVGWQTPVGVHMSSGTGFGRYLRWYCPGNTAVWTWNFRIIVTANPIAGLAVRG